MATSLHPHVILSSQVSKFFGLSVQLLLKLQTSVAEIVNAASDKDKNKSVDNLPENGNKDEKKRDDENERKAKAWSNEDLVVLIADLDTLSGWIERFFINYCDRLLPYTKLPPVAIPTPPYYTTSPVCRLLTSQMRSVNNLALNVFNKISSQLSSECRISLQAVKSIAGKYRMTNKPAPETASNYVKSILSPVRDFIDNHSMLIPPSIPSSWVIDCVESVTMGYLQEVKLLMETAKQMDTALQRRSKLRSTNTGNTAEGGSVGDGKLGDSEKISLQILLDVLAYGDELQSLSLNIEDSEGYRALQDEVADARSLLKS